jgi:hypothetical protein
MLQRRSEKAQHNSGRTGFHQRPAVAASYCSNTGRDARRPAVGRAVVRRRRARREPLRPHQPGHSGAGHALSNQRSLHAGRARLIAAAAAAPATAKAAANDQDQPPHGLPLRHDHQRPDSMIQRPADRGAGRNGRWLSSFHKRHPATQRSGRAEPADLRLLPLLLPEHGGAKYSAICAPRPPEAERAVIGRPGNKRSGGARAADGRQAAWRAISTMRSASRVALIRFSSQIVGPGTSRSRNIEVRAGCGAYGQPPAAWRRDIARRPPAPD